MRRGLLATLGLLLPMLTSGCAALGFTGETAPAAEAVEAPAAKPALEPAARWARALSLLEDGKAELAEAELVQLRKEAPDYHERADRMLRQIRTPIDELLPRAHFNVRLNAGQSLSMLSGRYFGDVLQFYALARYNGIPAPGRVAAGQLIRIPMTEQARSVRRSETGAVDTDDPIEPSSDGEVPATGGEAEVDEAETQSQQAQQQDGEGTEADTESLDPETRAEIRDYYRRATVAFQRQDLDQTLRYCGRVLELDPDHANCLGYRTRARELKRRLERLETEDNGAT